MTDITVRNDMTVELVDFMGSDISLLRAMLVASDKDDLAGYDMPDEAKYGRINRLMKDRHGTPFEHGSMTFYVEAPIFVFREWHRHRIGVSINEQSGRYSELPPMFYVPPRERPLKQVDGTKQMDYVMEHGTDEEYEWLVKDMMEDFADSYRRYQDRLARGVVKEVARMGLGVNIFSKMYWTCNPRSLMAFLSLRHRVDVSTYSYDDSEGVYYRAQDDVEHAMFPSRPMWEIDWCAQQMERAFAERFPITHAAFLRHGRVAP